ncbi:hypothetical protein AB3Y40_00440 [Yoonia sp. R2331]|uniref:hypothetical protein n=1 Tax=Yoonia sp. R2331 TaxID=3237238 RepID=UPI0034E55079
MNAMIPERGGAAVGHLQDYDSLKATAVIYLRMWCDGPDMQSIVQHDMTQALGAARGQRVFEAFCDLCRLCAHHGRRPLAHHALHCKCVGADEASFAQFIASATEGDREDAMLIAILLVRPDVAPVITSLATQFGISLKQMKLCARRAAAPKPTGRHRLH